MWTDFSKKKKSKKNFFFKKILKSRCHIKRRAGAALRARPSFGMTTTQDISHNAAHLTTG